MATQHAIALIRNELIAAANQKAFWEGQMAVFAAALIDAGWTAQQVAEQLGVSRATLYRMIAKAPGQLRLA